MFRQGNDLREIFYHVRLLSVDHNEFTVGNQRLAFLCPADVAHLLRHTGSNQAVFAAPLPGVHQPFRRGGIPQAVMNFVIPEPGGFLFRLVSGDQVPTEVLDNTHAHDAELLAEIPCAEAQHTVFGVHIGAPIEQVQRTVNVNLQRSCQILCFLRFLPEQRFIEILKGRDVLRLWFGQIRLVDLPDAFVNDRFGNGI